MATMVAPSRRVSLAHAVGIVREHYGFEADALRLTGERDENFKITAPGGSQYVLKIASPAEDAIISELAPAALLHIERVDPDFPCPRVVRERAGKPHVHFTDQDGAQRTACLLTYLPGKLLADAARSAQQRAACGRVAARLTCALAGFEHAAAHRAVVWDVRHTAYVWRLLEELPHMPHRERAAEVLRRIVPCIDSRLPRLRRQVVHNDINPLNILVEPANEAHVSGVIDFGDITHTALVADLAVAAAELVPHDCTDAAQAGECVRDVSRGYSASLPLLQHELALLGTLAAARLVMNVVVHEWHVHRNPAGDHYAALDADFIASRLSIAARMPLEEFVT